METLCSAESSAVLVMYSSVNTVFPMPAPSRSGSRDCQKPGALRRNPNGPGRARTTTESFGCRSSVRSANERRTFRVLVRKNHHPPTAFCPARSKFASVRATSDVASLPLVERCGGRHMRRRLPMYCSNRKSSMPARILAGGVECWPLSAPQRIGRRTSVATRGLADVNANFQALPFLYFWPGPRSGPRPRQGQMTVL